VRAITGGAIALKGQLLKAKGQLVAAKGQIISAGGDALSAFGRNVASNALMPKANSGMCTAAPATTFPFQRFLSHSNIALPKFPSKLPLTNFQEMEPIFFPCGVESRSKNASVTLPHLI